MKNDLTQIEDRIFKKLLEHDEQFAWIRENMVTKEDFRRVMDGQDKMVTILRKLDQESAFTKGWLRRVDERGEVHEVRLNEHDLEIRKIKDKIKT